MLLSKLKILVFGICFSFLDVDCTNCLYFKANSVCFLINSPFPCYSPLSESAATVGAGLAVPAAQTGRMPMAEVFKNAVQSFKVNDWSLFGVDSGGQPF